MHTGGMYGMLAVLMAMFAVIMLVVLVYAVIAIIAWWKIFTKAGEPGWKALIPYYSQYTGFKLAWKPLWFWIMLGISIISGIISGVMSAASGSGMSGGQAAISTILGLAVAVIYIIFYVKLSKAFGHGGGFACGLIFLNFIFLLILAFGSSEYVGPEGGSDTSAGTGGHTGPEIP